MELKRLRVFTETLTERLSSLPAEARSVAIFYFHDDCWRDLAGGAAVADAPHLEAVTESAVGYFRPPKCSSVYFHLRDDRAIARVEFSSAIKDQVQARCYEAIKLLRKDAGQFYRATHDPHTGLRNRSVFDQHLIEALQKSGEKLKYASPGDAQLSASLPSVFLLSLDIDHFKIINDRHGHGYGDVVLAALAWRLEVAAARAGVESGGRFSADVFRLGGEEFQLVLSGFISEPEAAEVAEFIRRSISSDSLPSAAEYNSLRSREFFDGTELPHDSDRRVSVSIGLAMAGRVGGGRGQTGASAALMKRQADIALYSAKMGGRNRVRVFSKIMGSFGRVSSVDGVNGVVAIDIGKEVGVKLGQEFFVCPPSYDGETDYFLGEGRSRKRVGKYPKIITARIVAFDVQNESSFCRVSEVLDGAEKVLEGSTLEAIPLGSITHLVSKVHRDAIFLDRQGLCVALERKMQTEAVAIYTANIRKIEEISDRKGLGFANDCLGVAGQQIISSVGPGAAFGQISHSSLTAVIACVSRDAAMKAAHSLHADLVRKLPDWVEVGVGWVFKPNDGLPFEMVGAVGVEEIIDGSLLAAAFGSSRAELVEEFGSDVLWWAIHYSKTQGRNDQAIADYSRFSRNLVRSSYVENQMGLLYSGLVGEEDSALNFFKSASEVPEANGIIRANYACMLVRVGRSQEGLQLALEIDDFPIEYSDALFYAALKVDADGFEEFVSRRPLGLVALKENHVWLSESQRAELRVAISSLST